MRWLVFFFLLSLPSFAVDCEGLEALSGESVLGKFIVPDDVESLAFIRQKKAWAKAAVNAIAMQTGLSPEAKAKTFELLTQEISRRADVLRNVFIQKHPDKAPPQPWGAERKETAFGTVFEGYGGHVVLIDHQGQVWTIQRYTSQRIDENWNPGWDAAKRPADQDPPKLVAPPQPESLPKAA